jgi:hypothetical protein
MAIVRREAEADRNADVLSDFRRAGFPASYASYAQCQDLDANSLVLFARELLSELRAAGLTHSFLFQHLEQFLADALASEQRLRCDLATLLAPGGVL